MDVEGAHHYSSALLSDRPIALIGLHAGILELQHRIPAAPKDRPFLILTAPAFSPPLTRFMAAGRELDGKRSLLIGNRRQRNRKEEKRKAGKRNAASREEWDGPDRNLESGLRSVIASKGILALMADQHPGPAEDRQYLDLWDAVRVPWPSRLLRFLSSQGFLCLPVSTRLEKDGTPRFTFHPALEEPTAGNVRAFLEAAIAAAPEQWNWSYPKVRMKRI